MTEVEATERWKIENMQIAERIRKRVNSADSENKSENLSPLNKYLVVRADSKPASPLRKQSDTAGLKNKNANFDLEIFNQIVVEGVDHTMAKYESNMVELRRQVYGGVKITDVVQYLEMMHPDVPEE